MTPLTDDEKRAIVAAFKELERAIREASGDVADRYGIFCRAYRGDSRAYVDAFSQASDRMRWIGQLRRYLMDEIDNSFWAT